MPFRIAVTESKAAAVVAVHGELDMSTVPEAEAAIADVARRKRSVTVDLRGVEFMDSTGVALLIRVDAQARQDGFHLFVAKARDEVQRVLVMCGVEEQLEMVDAPEDLNV
jgi:anti-sigma B factor antagonist